MPVSEILFRSRTEKLDQDLPPLVESLKTTSEHSTQMVDTAAEAIRDLQGRLDTTLDAISQAAKTGDQQLIQRGADLRTLFAASDQTMRQVRDLLTDARSLTRSAPGATLRVAAAAASLRGFANDVEHDPQLLLTGRRP